MLRVMASKLGFNETQTVPSALTAAPLCWSPWPKAGDIVECRFPHAVGIPGPKELPFNDAWFAPASKTNPPHPRRGKLDLTSCVLKRKLHAAVREAENLRKGQQTP
jgi:hypothetical protein